ncbi:response regulator [sulfur-oxidizing endosymbiont of Gigantopelta aegis]|uniref:response regulator n=1 Tax=sulfur-oxidizing endosymbiont of Gigantopelta aegis TaxID=2794934 RepID=UPI0018DD8389
MRILLIEDDISVADFIIKGLGENNHVVDHQADGKEGLFFATTENYDVMIVDRMLPGIEGLTIIRTIRASNIKNPRYYTKPINKGVDIFV